MKLAVIAATAAALLVASALATARAVACSNSRISSGPYSAPASRESASHVRCSTVHRLLGQAWIWRWGEVAWGVSANATPKSDSRRRAGSARS